MQQNVSASLPLLIAFIVGCFAAPFVVPPISAQNAMAGARQWEYLCLYADQVEALPSAEAADAAGADRAAAQTAGLTELGGQGWELVNRVTIKRGARGGSAWCLKRPR